MLQILLALLWASVSTLKSRKDLAIENLLLRQQLAIANRLACAIDGVVDRQCSLSPKRLLPG